MLKVFKEKYVNITSPIEFKEVHFEQKDGIQTELTIDKYGVHKVYHGKGNGRLDAVSNALKRHSEIDYTISTYEEHALETGSSSKACAYVAIDGTDGKTYWGRRHRQRYHQCLRYRADQRSQPVHGRNRSEEIIFVQAYLKQNDI